MKAKSFWENPFKKTKSELDCDIDFLSTVPIFDTLTRQQKRNILPLIHIRKYKQGEIVFRKNDPGVGLYIIRDGQVEVYNEYHDMKRKKIATLNTGEFFGEISLLNESPRSATVIASKQTVLLGLFKPDLLNFMDSNPKLGLQLIFRLAQVVAERLRLVNEEISG